MRRLWLAIGWLIVAVIVYFSLAPQVPDIGIEDGDKLEHLLAYASLMAWWSQLYISSPSRRKLGLACLALGAAMELAQGLTPARSPDLLDLLANATGILLGWLAAPPRLPNFYERLAAAFPGKPR